MKLAFSGVSSVHDAVIVMGLSQLAREMGVQIDAAPPAEAVIEAPAKTAEIPPTAPVTVKRKYTKRKATAKAAKPVKAAKKQHRPRQSKLPLAAEGEAPRLTIRQRIRDFVGSGTKTVPEIAAELARQGVALENRLVHQHCYLMTRDDVMKRDEATGRYSLVRR